MINKEKFMRLVSGQDSTVLFKVRQRIINREKLRKINEASLKRLILLDVLKLTKDKAKAKCLN